MAFGKAWDDHKYVARVPAKKASKDNKWRYFYSKDAYQAYLKNEQSNAKNTTGGFFGNILNKGKSFVSKVTKSAVKVADLSKDVIENGKELIESVREYKYVAKEKMANGKTRYFYSEKEYQAYLKGKEFIEKNLNESISMTPSETFEIYTKNFLTLAMVNGFGNTMFNTVASGFTALKVKMESPESFDELDKIDKPTTNEEDQAITNPNYSPVDYGYSQNCSFCTAAYDLRSRGYDVEASAISTMEAYDAQAILDWYDGEDFSGFVKLTYNNPVTAPGVYDVEKAEGYAASVESNLKEYGEGARGHFLVYWRGGGGHDVIWEVENGEVVIRDCQVNDTYELSELLLTCEEVGWFRSDNVEPNEKILRTVKNRD